MKEIFLSIFKTSEERLKNPFIGTFIISFIALNWRPISIFLLSKEAIENKIIFIVSKYDNIWNLLFLPLIISLIYILILPYLMFLFEFSTFKAFQKRNENLYKTKIVDIDGKKLVAQSEIELENLKSDYKEKSDLNKQIQILKESADIKDLEIISLKEDAVQNIQTTIMLEQDIRNNEELIKDLRFEISDYNSSKLVFNKDFSNTPINTVSEFINFLPSINDFSLAGQALQDRYVNNDRFIALGLLRISKDKLRFNGKDVEYLELTDKGLFFINKAFERKLA